MERDRREYKEADVAKWLAEQQQEPVLYQWFIAIQKDYDKALAPQYTAFLTKHRSELEVFYPDLYGTGYLKRAGIVPEETSSWGALPKAFPSWQR